MKRLIVVALVVAGLVLPGVASAKVQEGKWVRGTVASLAGDTLTVKVSGQDMAFTVDKATRVIARGAGTKAAQAAPMGGPKIGDLLKPGDGVEVHFVAKGAGNYATMIRAGLEPSETAAAPKEGGKSVTGKVSSVAAQEIAVSADGKDFKFAVSSATLVVGEGAGTLTREKKEAGAAPVLTDFVKVGDTVVVAADAKGAAKEIRVIAKAK